MTISLLRTDDRLIHGQLMYRIVQNYKIDNIILIDDVAANNSSLKRVYKLSVPAGVNIEVETVEKAADQIKAAQADDSKTLILFRYPKIAKLLFEDDELDLPQFLNVGPMSSREDTKRITFFSNLLNEEIEELQFLIDKGVDVYFQQVPGEKKYYLKN